MKLDVKRLHLELARLCLSKKELCDLSGVDVVTLSRIINGSQNPRPATIGRIAKALGVDVTELLED